MATDHNFRIKNGLEVGGQLIVNSSGQLVVADVTSNLDFADNIKARFGDDNDLQIYHDGSSDVIKNTTGNQIYMQSTGFNLSNSSGLKHIYANNDYGVTLFYQNSGKLETVSGGINVTGTVNVNGDYTLPTSDGTNGQVIKTNGSGTLSFGSATLDSLSDCTISSATPNATTNPPYAGAMWIEEDTGDVYVCTNATTDNNTWVKTGSADGITTSGSNTIIQSPDDTNVIHVNNSANVGIGTSIANHKVNIHTDDDDDYALRIEGSTNNAAVWTGIGLAGEESNTKAAIIFKDIAQSYARGDLIFALNNSTDQSNATPSDAKMTITHQGYITAPNQVAFSVAKNNGYQTDDNVFVCDSSTGSRNHNDGSHYNTSNGRFTAPVAGRYWFSFSVQTHDSGGVVQSWVALRKNGSIVQYNLQHKTGGYHTRFDMSISLKLAANDYIEAYVGESGTSSGWQGSASEYNNFSGFLIG